MPSRPVSQATRKGESPWVLGKLTSIPGCEVSNLTMSNDPVSHATTKAVPHVPATALMFWLFKLSTNSTRAVWLWRTAQTKGVVPVLLGVVRSQRGSSAITLPRAATLGVINMRNQLVPRHHVLAGVEVPL